MFKIFSKINNIDKIKLLLLILIGAISEPLIAYAYVLLGAKLSNFENSNTINSLLPIFSVIIIALIIAGINYLCVDLIMNNIATNIRKKIFSNILNKNSSEIIKTERTSYYNDILKKIDIWKFRYLKSVIDVLEKSLQIFFTLIFISLIDFRVTVVVVIFLIPLVINNIFFPKKMEKAHSDYIEKDNEQLKKMKEYLDAILIIKNHNEEKEYSSKMDKVLDEQNTLWKKVSILGNTSAFIANSGVILSQFSGILISILFYTKGYLELGSLIALIQLTMFVNQPVINLINATIGISSMNEMNEYIEEVHKNFERELENTNNIKFNKIEVKNLNYQYNENKQVFFNDISTIFEKGKKYLIIGESGSGKSTFIKILLKYLTNFSGEINVDNIPLNDITEKTINENIFYIPQKLFIFSDTIKNNIDIKNEYNNNLIFETIKEMNLENIINKKEGLFSLIGEEINEISGGEKARLYIVKAKLSSKEIIIADEILSNLDKENSLNVENCLLSLKNKTLIHIAHNYNKEYMKYYDEILKL